MRGAEPGQRVMFSYVDLEQRIAADHPLRAIHALVEPVLGELSPRFAGLYAESGRPSIPPEQLLRALLLQVLYAIRSERQLMEQLDYNLLFRWFVGLSMNDPVWDPTVFTKNRDRLLSGEIHTRFFQRVLEQAKELELLSGEHFTVDGTLVEAWAGHKSFKPKEGGKDTPPDDPGNPTVDFTGQKRSNKTHASTTDPDARLYRKSFGTESKLCYSGHLLMDNRHGLAVNARLTEANPAAEWDAALEMASRIPNKRRERIKMLVKENAHGFQNPFRGDEIRSGPSFFRNLLVLLCHKTSSRPCLLAAPQAGAGVEQKAVVIPQYGCDRSRHMALRPQGQRPAGGNLGVAEGRGGRTEAQGGKAERARWPGRRRPPRIRCRGGGSHANPSLHNDPGRTRPSVLGNRARCATAAWLGAPVVAAASREASWKTRTWWPPVLRGATR